MPESPSPESYLPLHALEFQILLALSAGVAHAYRIVGQIEQRQPKGSTIHPTNLYRRIWRLAEQGLVEEASPEADEGGRSRKYFSITPLGRAVAVAEAGRLRELLAQAAEFGIPSGGGGR